MTLVSMAMAPNSATSWFGNPPANFSERSISFGNWKMLCDRFEVIDSKGNLAPLTTGEFLLLKGFLMSPGRVLSRDYLLNITRGVDYNGLDRAIDVQIGRVRKKLHDDYAHPFFIKTIRDVGYIFLPKVSYENF